MQRLLRWWHVAKSSKGPLRWPGSQPLTVLGIETSCDDTGVAIVNDQKEIKAESLHCQGKMHREFGGIIPIIARDVHSANIHQLTMKTLEEAELCIDDIDAVAVSNQPGLTMSLLVGVNYAKELATKAQKPLIPIHHMEAHALTARLTNKVEFPFLVMLMSGGHCLLLIAEDVSSFKLLGTGIDTSPGDMLDKTARRLKLKTLPDLADLCGGAAIERLALTGNTRRYQFPPMMSHHRDCNFSFSGLQFNAKKYIEMEENELGLGAVDVIPSAADLCASLQYAVVDHMSKRLYRAFTYCDMKQLLPASNRTLVLSGGVASNSFIRKGLATVAEHFDCEVVCPPPRLCTDNGVMVAWNGVEKLQRGIDVIDSDIDKVDVKHRSPFGDSLINQVAEANIQVTSRMMRPFKA